MAPLTNGKRVIRKLVRQPQNFQLALTGGLGLISRLNFTVAAVYDRRKGRADCPSPPRRDEDIAPYLSLILT
jgi:hypothetical protein